MNLKKVAFLQLSLAVALILTSTAKASTVTATITGTVTSVVNCNASGGGCVFGTLKHLDGLSFTLVFTFDDTLGSTKSSFFEGVENSSTITTNVTNPGTAILTIIDPNNNPWSYNFNGGTTHSSTATRNLDTPGHGLEDAYWHVQDGLQFGSDTITATIFPLSPGTHLSSSADWEFPISLEDVNPRLMNISFQINAIMEASGYLQPSTYQVTVTP